MKRLCFSFVLSFASLIDAATWTINRDILEERLPEGVAIEELVRVLEKEGVEVHFEVPKDLTLWRGERASISLAPSPFSSFYILPDPLKSAISGLQHIHN